MTKRRESTFPLTLTYNDISLVPRVMSEIESRNDPDTKKDIPLRDTFLKFPVIASPMDTVCNSEMAIALEELGGLGIIHRFQSVATQAKEVLKFMFSVSKKYEHIYNGLQISNGFGNSIYLGNSDRINVGFAISAVSFEKRLDAVMETIMRFGMPPELRIWICVDTANGFHIFVKDVIQYISKKYESYQHQIVLIAGNVASKEGYLYLAGLGVDGVRCGISNGSPCTTGIVTGVGQGIASTILECVDAKMSLIARGISPPLIIADGSIQSSGDISKSIALGSDLVMMGSMLAGFKESPSPLYKKPRKWLEFTGDWLSVNFTGVPVLDFLFLSQDQKKWWKPYRGMASHTANEISNKLNNTNKKIVAEGVESKVPYLGSVYDGLVLIQGGVRSTMSYFNALNLETFVLNTSLPDSIVQQTYFAHIERTPFIKNNGW